MLTVSELWHNFKFLSRQCIQGETAAGYKQM
jgi:hypothetical protein